MGKICHAIVDMERPSCVALLLAFQGLLDCTIAQRHRGIKHPQILQYGYPIYAVGLWPSSLSSLGLSVASCRCACCSVRVPQLVRLFMRQSACVNDAPAPIHRCAMLMRASIMVLTMWLCRSNAKK